MGGRGSAAATNTLVANSKLTDYLSKTVDDFEKYADKISLIEGLEEEIENLSGLLEYDPDIQDDIDKLRREMSDLIRSSSGFSFSAFEKNKNIDLTSEYERLIDFAKSKGIKVYTEGLDVSIFENINDTGMTAHGFFLPGKNEIYMNPSLSAEQRISTMSHELGHALLRQEGSGPTDVASQKYAYDEIQAETFSYLALARLGVDKSSHSTNYLRYYAKDFMAKDRGFQKRAIGDRKQEMVQILNEYESFKKSA